MGSGFEVAVGPFSGGAVVGGLGLAELVGTGVCAAGVTVKVGDAAGADEARGVAATCVRRASTVWRACVILIVGVIFDREDGLLHPTNRSSGINKRMASDTENLGFILSAKAKNLRPCA